MTMYFHKGVGYSIDGYLRELLDTYKEAVNYKNTSFVLCIDGRSGMGKTTLATQIGAYLDPDFNLSKVYFSPKEFLEGLMNAKKGDFICFDEAMALSSRSALSEINRAVVIAMSQIRSKNIYVCFNVNSIFDLDRNLALSRADLLLHTYGPNIFTRGTFCAFFKAKDGQERIKTLYLNGKKMYDYSKPKANFYGSFSAKFLLNEQEYEAKKQIGINQFIKKPIGKRERLYKSSLKKAIVYLKSLGMTQIDIDKIIEYGEENISRLLSDEDI